MSSTSPFKKKQLKELIFIENLDNIENFPKTFKQLQEQKTCRTIVDSDVHHVLGESRKTIISQIRQSRKESLSYNDDLLRLKQAQILKLEQSLFLQKGINECLREQIHRNKERITELVDELDGATEKNWNRRDQNLSNQKQEAKVIGILKNNPKKQQQLEQNQTLRFGSPKPTFKAKNSLQLENKRLRKYIEDLEQNFMKCKYLLQDVEEKSKIIQTKYEADIRSLKMKNQYLTYQIKEFN